MWLHIQFMYLQILDRVCTVNHQILTCYYIWRIWRIACFRKNLSPPTYMSIVHYIDGSQRDAKFNSSQITVNHYMLRNAKFYSRQNELSYSIQFMASHIYLHTQAYLFLLLNGIRLLINQFQRFFSFYLL